MTPIKPSLGEVALGGGLVFNGDEKERSFAAQAGLHQNVYFVLVAGRDIGECFFVQWDNGGGTAWGAAAMSGRNRSRNSTKKVVKSSLNRRSWSIEKLYLKSRQARRGKIMQACNFSRAAGSERM